MKQSIISYPCLRYKPTTVRVVLLSKDVVEREKTEEKRG